MNQRQAYWLLQIGGWTFYSFSDLVFFMLLLTPKPAQAADMVFNSFIYIITGIALTHFFRAFFKRYIGLKLSMGQMALRCILGVLLITSLFTMINITLYDWYFETSTYNWLFKDLAFIMNFAKPMIIWVLLYIFVAYTIQMQNSHIEKIKLYASIEASEAKILRAQINPHFMFNALNSIRALIFEDPKKAQNGITQLSNILRSSLVADRKTTISLKEELRTVEDYLTLEKIRYEERLQSKLEIAPETMHVQIPPMMIQTLVENAIKHGVQKAEKWGFVEVKTHIESGYLLINIRNTGVFHDHDNHADDSGFGLENTRRRLRLVYGGDASFHILQEDSTTVSATVKIPLVTENNNHNENHHS